MTDEEKKQEKKAQDKLIDSGGLAGEVSQLINKYAGGQIPVLVDEKDPKNGLINGELLKIYQRGFAGENLVPLGVLFAKSTNVKWEEGNADYHLSEWSKGDWTKVCSAIRLCTKGNKECELCDRQWAAVAKGHGDVVAYMCVHGLVDFAMPIFVEKEAIAVIFTGQVAPKEGTFWNREFVEENGVFLLEGCDNSGVEARRVTLERFGESERQYGLKAGTLLRKLNQDVDANDAVEVTPEDVEELRNKLREAGRHLSNLAESTYRLEKSKAVGGLKSAIAWSAAQVDVERVAETLPSIVEGVSEAATLICEYFGIDYMLVLNIKTEKSSFRILLENTPEKMPWKRGVWADELDEESFRGLADVVASFPRFLADADLWPLRKRPFFDWVATWLQGKQASRCVGARLDRAGLLPCVLLAGRKAGLKLSDFHEQDKSDFARIIEDIGAVINIVLFIDELRAAGESQDVFLEDVAHEIRSPVQNLLIKIERLKSGSVQPNEVLDEVGRLGAQVRRIHQLSQRIWVLERLRRGYSELDKRGLVGVHQAIMEVVRTLDDVAKGKNLTILVAWQMKEWRAIRIDHDLFFQAMLNLVDNAIKYSSEGTEIRIDGEMKLYPKCRISVINRGIEIKEQYRDNIFKRGVRTSEAKMHIWQGSGIGLCIVKAFADFYHGDVKVECNPIQESSDFVTEFRLTFTGAFL
ncbi:MAG: PocR ligand-binding domain-containing protein [Sedimentisphaerales bacterium]